MSLTTIAKELRTALAALSFTAPVAYVYNPLEYAWEPHRRYLARYGKGQHEVVFVGMNPGPWGMVQTGVPFGDVKMVRDWLEIEGAVGHPPHEHPKRPVQGFACKRHEPSGTLLWGWARDRYETPERFFKRYFVVNYCPLAFFDEAGSNLTPDKLRAAAKPLLTLCDEALARSVAELRPRFVIGVGGFAAKRAEIALKDSSVTISSVLHPSPANPKARHDWKGQVTKKLQALGIE